MTARSPEFEAILAANPADQGVRLIYADWCEERGDVSYARALRWLAENKRWPVPSGPKDGEVGPHCTYAFTHEGNSHIRPGNLYEARSLPRPLLEKIEALIRQDFPDAPTILGWNSSKLVWTSWSYWCGCSTCQLATEYLARALDES